MKKAISRCLVVFAAVSLMGVLGCATSKTHSGFLDNYGKLRPGPEGGVKERYIKPGADFSKYGRVMFDTPVFFISSGSEYKGIDPDDMQALSEICKEEAAKALSESYPIVDAPAPDVLRIRIAITNLKPSRPGVSTLSTVTPVGLGMNVLRKAAGAGYPGAGETGIEGELLDSTTNEQLAAFVDDRQGGKVSSFTKWGSAKEAFGFWTGRLKMFLDQAHGVAPKKQ